MIYVKEMELDEDKSSLLLVALRDYHIETEVYPCADAEDLNNTYNSHLQDYGETGWNFKVYELTLREREFNIIDPVPARLALI